MVKYCSACTVNRKDKNLHIHRFPKEPRLRQKWLDAMVREGFVATSCSRLCANHFEPDDYEIGGIRKRLKKDAVPSVFKSDGRRKKKRKRIGASSSNASDGSEADETYTEDPIESGPPSTSKRKEDPPETADDQDENKRTSKPRKAKQRPTLTVKLSAFPIKRPRLKEITPPAEKVPDPDKQPSNPSTTQTASKENLCDEIIKQFAAQLRRLPTEFLTVANVEVHKVLSKYMNKAATTPAPPASNLLSSLGLKEKEKAKEVPKPSSEVEVVNLSPRSESSWEAWSPLPVEVNHDCDEDVTEEPDVNKENELTVNQKKTVDSSPTKSAQNNVEYFYCELCFVAFPSRKDLTDHKDTDHNNDPETNSSTAKDKAPMKSSVLYTCAECSYKTLNKIMYYRHRKIHQTDRARPIACAQCPSRFFDNGSLKKHMKTHNDERPFYCAHCPYRARSKYQLTVHMKRHLRPKILVTQEFPCEHCDYKANQKYRLMLHMRTHSDVKSYACDECDFKSAWQQGLQKHKLKHSGGSLPFLCSECGALYKSKYSLQQHLKRHKEQTPLACTLCDFTTIQRRILQKHMKVVHKWKRKKRRENLKMLRCGECDYTSMKSSLMSAHRKIHWAEKPWSCDKCDYKTTQKGHLTRHIILKHTELKPHACDQCERRFAYNSELEYHVKAAHEGQPLKCPHCNYTAEQRSTITQHVALSHSDKGHKCPYCNFMCKWKTAFVNHVRKHTGEKPYACQLCDYRGRAKVNLKIHMMKHTKEKPHLCNICAYRCSTKGSLQVHMRRHTGEKPFSCGECGASFKQKSALTKHTSVHTGEKPYQCMECRAGFRDKGSLNKHMKKHSGMLPFACNFCDYQAARRDHFQKHMDNRHRDTNMTVQVQPTFSQEQDGYLLPEHLLNL